MRSLIPILSVCIVPLLLAEQASAAPTPAAPGEDLYVAHIDGMEGYVDRDGAVVIPPHFTLAHVFHEGLAKVSTPGPKRLTGFIDPTGAWVVRPTLRSAKSFSEGRAAAMDAETRKWGYLDRAGAWVVPPRFERAMPFSDGRATVELRGRKGASIDRSGRIVFHFPPGAEVGDPPRFSEGLMGIELDDTVRYVDVHGRAVFEGPWRFGRPFAEGLAAVRGADGWAFVDRTGAVVLDGFDFAWSFREGLAAVRRKAGEKMGYVDRTGAWVIEPAFDRAGGFGEGLARQVVDGRMGYIDRRGAWVIEPVWADPMSSASTFRRGRAMVGRKRADGKLVRGYIGRTGKVVIQPTR